MRQNRAAYTTVASGIQHEKFALTAPLYPDAGNMLWPGIIGQDFVTGSTPTNSTTLASAAAAGVTTISTTATFTAGTKIQVDTSANGNSEVFTVTGAPTGAGPFLVTLDRATKYAHLSAATVANVVSPFTHNFNPSLTLPSYSFEANMNGADVQLFGGVLSKAEVKLATNAEAQVAWSVDAQQRQTISSPATPTWPADAAIGPAGISATFNTNADVTMTAGTLTIDGGTKVYDTMSGQYYPQGIVGIERKVDFKATLFLQNVAGGLAVQDYFTSLTANPVPTVAIVLTIASGANNATFTLPAAILDKWSIKAKKGDLAMLDTEWKGTLQGVTNDVQLAITNTNFLTY